MKRMANNMAFIGKMQYEPHEPGDVILITGVGEAFPFIRVHALLDAMHFGSDGGTGSMVTIVIVIIAVILAAIIGSRLYIWNKNNHSPRETGKARVVTKRMKVSGMGGHRLRSDIMADTTSSTTTRYFVTFELENGKRLEFHVNDGEYGMLAEGDSGELTWQGTRYLGFER